MRTWSAWRAVVFQCYVDPPRATVHFASSALIVWSLAALAQAISPVLLLSLASVFALSLSERLPRRLWLITLWSLALLCSLAIAINAPASAALLILAGSYSVQGLGQLLAQQVVTPEVLRQCAATSVWQLQPAYLYYVWPLAIASIGRWLVTPDTPTAVSLDHGQLRQALSQVEVWARQQRIQPSTTQVLAVHWGAHQDEQLNDWVRELSTNPALVATLQKLYSEVIYRRVSLERLNVVQHV
ncbi:MAG: hypothetical protein AAGF24_12980, partial [Cyanobacteria bacterium P01_H01_bin.121]